MVESCSRLPMWLEALLTEKFFNFCLVHEDAKKNEKNIFCVDCCEAICHHCSYDHNSHHLLQIRRYVYHDVIRVDDVEKLMDCSSVQAYTINHAKVVFLNSRPQTRPCKSSSSFCISCDRSLQDPYVFCSISCKVNEIMKIEGETMSEYLHECKILTLPEPEGLMAPGSVLEPVYSLKTSSGSTCGKLDHLTISCTATTDYVVRKKRTTKYETAAAARITVSHAPLGRRKSVPRRSPFI